MKLAETQIVSILAVRRWHAVQRWLLPGWAKANGVALQYIQPGKPNHNAYNAYNAYVERFYRTFREELLDRTHLPAQTMSARRRAAG